jgi:transcriptional regulator with XRE-family HTH domain
MIQFSDWLKEKRIESDMTQDELAQKIGVERGTVSNWETAVCKPKPENQEQIEELFGEAYDEDALRPSAFGEWLRRRRTEEGLTQEELEEKSGVSYVTISFIETGRTTSPQTSTIQALEDVLGSPSKETTEQLEEEREIEGVGEFLGPFPRAEWQENADSVPCVYVIYDEIGRPVRIGQTKDLQRRLTEYDSHYWWFRSPTAESFAYAIIPDETTRKDIERTITKFMGANAIFNSHHRI